MPGRRPQAVDPPHESPADVQHNAGPGKDEVEDHLTHPHLAEQPGQQALRVEGAGGTGSDLLKHRQNRQTLLASSLHMAALSFISRLENLKVLFLKRGPERRMQAGLK